MSNEMLKQEMKEAIEAGEIALSSLRIAKERLDSAKNWGVLDMLGGGLVTGMVKHSKIDDASYYIENAKKNLLWFQKELQEVHVPVDLKAKIGAFLSFADFFFDGLVADYLVQSKISEAREEVADAIWRVSNVLIYLKAQYDKL